MKRIYRTLSDFLEQTGTTQEAFAARVGCSQPVISVVVRGLRSPGFQLAARIAAEARVPIESLLPQSQSTRRAARPSAETGCPQTR